LEKFKADGAAVFGLDRRGGKLNLFTFRPPKRIVWVLGNEARGLGGDVRRTLTGTVSIPVDGVDSLNVAMAATLVAYRSHFMRPAREKRS
jgi:tRNA G18 (ribose-2'-O)-methylase SpoU